MTPYELERRRSVVGASEVGLLFGLPSFGGRTVSDLWFEKKYGVIQSKGNASTALGHKLEPVVLEMAEERLGLSIVDRQKWMTLGNNGATLDGRIENNGAIVEAKTSGILWHGDQSEWGPDGSDETPDLYLVQVQSQLLVSGAELAYLAALIGGRGFAMYEIKPQHQLMQAIQVKSTQFIESLRGDTPPAEPPQLETLKRIRRQPDKVLQRSDEIDELYERYVSVNESYKAAEKVKEEAQSTLLAKLQDAEAAECQGGLLTYFEQTRKESYVKESKFRVLRFKKGSR